MFQQLCNPIRRFGGQPLDVMEFPTDPGSMASGNFGPIHGLMGNCCELGQRRSIQVDGHKRIALARSPLRQRSVAAHFTASWQTGACGRLSKA